jgi:Protein of unknown function (DUF1194)
MRPILLLLLVLYVPAARAAEPVDVALVLVSDVSRSIDDGEYALEKQGYASALISPEFVAAITEGEHHAIAIAYVEFAGVGEVRQVLDWTIVRDAASAGDFSARLAAAPRSYVGRTAIGEAVALAQQVLGAGAFAGARQVIDVCGDGTNNAGRAITEARDAAVAAGITINGLTIINDHPKNYYFAHVQPPGGLTKYYQDNVIGGPGAFALEVHDFAGFGTAFIRKLVQEIAFRPGPAVGRLAAR